jgi:poly(ADP-ribose) glycohydrolase ARH3
MAGAVVEAESPEYIAATFRSVDDILAVESVPEFSGPAWAAGRFTDDTQMSMCVAEWLLDDDSHSAELLLAKFATAYEPWRRYGPGTAAILQMFARHQADWRQLSTAMLPEGSYGNGSAMRAAPIGLAYSDNLKKAVAVAIESSRPTHSHSLGYQGAVLQSIAVAAAMRSGEFAVDEFLETLRQSLVHFSDLQQDTSPFTRAIAAIESGLRREASCAEMALTLGTGISAIEAVPMAIYCFLRHPHSYADVIHNAIFIGGDTDTIAGMAGAISGASLGADAIPRHWISAIQDAIYPAMTIEAIADRLAAKFPRN